MNLIVEKYLNNNTQQWSVDANQFQIGNLSYTYWGQIVPADAPLGKTCGIGFAISKKFKWARAERKSQIYQNFNSPSIILWHSFSDKMIADVDPTSMLRKQSVHYEFEVLRRHRDKLTQMGCCVRDHAPNMDATSEKEFDVAKVETIQEYFDRHESGIENGFIRLYSRPYNIVDFMIDGLINHRKTVEIEREMIKYRKWNYETLIKQL